MDTVDAFPASLEHVILNVQPTEGGSLAVFLQRCSHIRRLTQPSSDREGVCHRTAHFQSDRG